MIPHTSIIRISKYPIQTRTAKPGIQSTNTTMKVIEEDFIIARKVFDGTS